MRSITFIFCLFLLFGINTRVHASTPQIQSIFSSFAHAKRKKSQIRHFDHFQLITGREGKNYRTTLVKGRLLRQYFEVPDSYSEQNILDNFIKQIVSNKGQILYQCSDVKECGDGRRIQKTIKPLNNTGDNHPQLVTAKIVHGKKTVFVSVYVHSCCGRNGLEVDEVTEAAEPLDLVKLNTKVLAASPTEIKFSDRSGKDKKNAHDHPLISRLPGSYIRKYKTSGFEKTNLVIGREGKKKYKHTQVSGKTTFIGYVLPRKYSELEVVENYRNALITAGFEEQFSCQSSKCGNQNRFSDEVHALETVGNDQSQRYLLAKLKRAEGDIWASVYVTGYVDGLWLNVNIIESNQIIKDRVAVDANAIKNAIESTGHIALDGIFFEFDSDKLKPASMDVIKELATYIKSVPNYRFYVVGHTDDKGDMSYNNVLSEKRATKVRYLLVNKFHINSKRLTAKGIGEFSPKNSNMTEQGRQNNRRVELVLRSDAR